MLTDAQIEQIARNQAEAEGRDPDAPAYESEFGEPQPEKVWQAIARGLRGIASVVDAMDRSRAPSA